MRIASLLPVLGLSALAFATTSLLPSSARACSPARNCNLRVAGTTLPGPVIAVPVNMSLGAKDAPTLFLGDTPVDMTIKADGTFLNLLTAKAPLAPGHYTLRAWTCASPELSDFEFDVGADKPIPTQAGNITVEQKQRAADPNEMPDTCGTRRGESFDHIRATVGFDLPAELGDRLALIRLRADITGPGGALPAIERPAYALTGELRSLTIGCNGSSGSSALAQGDYAVTLSPELVGVGPLPKVSRSFSIRCASPGIPGTASSPEESWGEGEDSAQSSGTSGCSAAPNRTVGASPLAGLCVLGLALAARRRRSAR